MHTSFKLNSIHFFHVVLVLSICFAGIVFEVQAQTATGYDRDRGRSMLRTIKNDLLKNYYDPDFRGIDVEARFKAADEKIKTATSNGQIFGIIAQALLDFNDSHTFFMPPSRAQKTDYGWQMQLIGDKCYVVAVKPKSGAQAVGLEVGDEVWSLDGFEPTRENLWKIKYSYYTLSPRAGMRLVVRKPGGEEKELEVIAQVTAGKRVMDLTGDDIWTVIRDSESEDRLHRHRLVELNDEVMIWKMPQFDQTDSDVDEVMNKARKFKVLVLDLRGNGGGAVSNLLRLVGHFFESDLKVAELKGRKELKPMVAKSRGDKIFKGSVTVLVDSESGSASEIFARLMQLKKRGTVIGDRTAGAVMRSRRYGHKSGIDVVAFFSASITDADVIMSDDASLEHVGVTPDLPMLPNAADLAAGRDPVLSHALSLAGITLDPQQAGAFFPIEWRK